jgi:ER lumen protein retaining receptor
MPQLFMLSKTGSAETITAHYLFALGIPYICNHGFGIGLECEIQEAIEHSTLSIGFTDITRVRFRHILFVFFSIIFFISEDFLDIIALVAGIVQTVLYADFFYLYVTKVKPLCDQALPSCLRWYNKSESFQPLNTSAFYGLWQLLTLLS